MIHVGGLGFLLVVFSTVTRRPEFQFGSFLGIATSVWAALAIANAIAHQVYVWLCWRLELHNQALTRHFGKNVFQTYFIVFVILIISRPLLVFALAWSNRSTMPLDPWVGYVTAAVLFVPAFYVIHSVRVYFGFKRAFGIDHFDPSYRDRPMVAKGVFAWTKNGMYAFGLLFFWAVAFLFQSVTALAVAAFYHLYIWVHYFATEKPDMLRIYGRR